MSHLLAVPPRPRKKGSMSQQLWFPQHKPQITKQKSKNLHMNEIFRIVIFGLCLPWKSVLFLCLYLYELNFIFQMLIGTNFNLICFRD